MHARVAYNCPACKRERGGQSQHSEGGSGRHTLVGQDAATAADLLTSAKHLDAERVGMAVLGRRSVPVEHGRHGGGAAWLGWSWEAEWGVGGTGVVTEHWSRACR